MFKLMTIALLSSTIALGPCMATNERVEDRQPITTENVKRATYDDTNHTITLTANELNSYTFNELRDFIYDILEGGTYDSMISEIDYNNSIFIEDELSTESGPNNEDLLNYYFWADSDYIRFNNGIFQYYPNEILSTFEYSITLSISSNYYAGIKSAIEFDIQSNAPTPTPTTSLFDSIYDYFNDKVFDSEYLNDYEMEIMGHTTSMRHYLCLTATIIFITLIVIFCVGFIVMLVKFVANMLINLGR